MTCDKCDNETVVDYCETDNQWVCDTCHEDCDDPDCDDGFWPN